MRSCTANGPKFVLIIPDGAGDRGDGAGLTSLQAAALPWMDQVAARGFCGQVQTLYPELPKGSLVAQLGMLGWDPRQYCPGGRASCELLALEGVALGPEDLAFRANLVNLTEGRLRSYNAFFIESCQAEPLIGRVQSATREEFPEFELYHNLDFRNTLVVRGCGIEPSSIACPEPHEIEGQAIDTSDVVQGTGICDQRFIERMNRYLLRVHHVLSKEQANFVFPWSAAKAFTLPPFHQQTGFQGRVAVVGCMDFLHGITKAGDLDFVRVGNGRPNTDYRRKGETVIALLAEGYDFVVCHVNGPDEAAHMGDRALKIRSLEHIDRWIVKPVLEFFEAHPECLGGMMIAPDHYTNLETGEENGYRWEAHSIHPVPFTLFDGRRVDTVRSFDEAAAVEGRYGKEPINPQRLLHLLGVASSS